MPAPLTLSTVSPGTLLLNAQGSQGDPAANIHVLNSPTYGEAYSFGNTPGSFTFSGTGSPADIYGPVVIYQTYGGDNHGAAVTKSTQAWFSSVQYYGPTTDDSAECGSCFVALKQISGGFTQTKAVTAFEAQAQVESGNTVTGASVVGVGSRINLIGSAAADTIEFLHMALNTTGGGGGTVTNAYGVRQINAWGATNSYGAYLIDKVQSEDQFLVAKSGDTGTFRVGFPAYGTAFMYLQNPQSTNYATVRLQAISGQTAALMEFWANGGSGAAATVNRLGTFISNTGFVANNSGNTVSMVKMSTAGFYWLSSTLEQATVGAAGGASALPATPSKYLKVVDSAGATLVIPAYAAA